MAEEPEEPESLAFWRMFGVSTGADGCGFGFFLRLLRFFSNRMFQTGGIFFELGATRIRTDFLKFFVGKLENDNWTRISFVFGFELLKVLSRS